MKAKEELNALKEEAEILNRKRADLTEDELKHVSGGFISSNSSTPTGSFLNLQDPMMNSSPSTGVPMMSICTSFFAVESVPHH